MLTVMTESGDSRKRLESKIENFWTSRGKAGGGGLT